MWFGVMRRTPLRREATRTRALATFLFAATAFATVLPLAISRGLAQDAPESVLDAPAMLGGSKSHADTALAGDKSRTRFVIGLEKSVEFQVFSLANPNRVIVELPDAKLQLPTLSGTAPVGLVQSVRGGLSAPGKMRVVIDVTGPVIVEKATIEKVKDASHAARLVLEIVPADGVGKAASATAKRPLVPAAGLGATGLQPPLPRPAVRPDQRALNVFKPIIVIDPGHGGHDSGAQKYGTVEKDVVLAFSLRLRDKLEASGRYKVLMTRDKDNFVELDERRDFADRSKAALFIAVHADYAGSGARGATIYSLRDNVANELQRTARGQISSDVLSSKELISVKAQSDDDVSAVKGFLTALAMKELVVNHERTKTFAGAVVETMGATTNMMNNPDREAGFRVLKSAKMPSVLIELAYVTNRDDAANLKSDSWRDKVSGSIVTALDNYFSHHASRLPM